jgi:hypothetical protein
MHLQQQVTRQFLSPRSRLFMLAAALLFLLSQAVVLQHTHDGDLQRHADCQICLKAGSKHDLAVVGGIAEPAPVAMYSYLAAVVNTVDRDVPLQKSRAPPRLA